VQVALWISAFEILAHPGKAGRSDLGSVIRLIDNNSGPLTELSERRYRIAIGKNKRYSVSLAGKLYKRLYDARNMFLHGNPLSTTSLRASDSPKAKLLTMAAPLLYMRALRAVLRVESEKEWDDLAIQEFADYTNADEALLVVVGKKDDPNEMRARFEQARASRPLRPREDRRR
jgi:hypothetical protein